MLEISCLELLFLFWKKSDIYGLHLWICVTTHLPNQLAPKMDGAKARDPHPAIWASAMPRVLQRPSVQILVVVANIQMRTLKAEEEKGSM